MNKMYVCIKPSDYRYIHICVGIYSYIYIYVYIYFYIFIYTYIYIYISKMYLTEWNKGFPFNPNSLPRVFIYVFQVSENDSSPPLGRAPVLCIYIYIYMIMFPPLFRFTNKDANYSPYRPPKTESKNTYNSR
jgi:hypothetical protein